MIGAAYTSRRSLRETLQHLRGLQLEVYEAILNWPHLHIGPSLQDLAAKLNRKEGSICGRINELREAGAIEDAPIKIGTCGKQVKTYRAVIWTEPKPEQQMTFL